MRERHPGLFDAMIWPAVILGDALVLLSFVATGFLVVQKLGGEHNDLAITGGAFAGAYVLLVHPGAWLGTRIGFKTVSLMGAAMFVAGPLVVALSPSLLGVALGMGILGAGGGTMWPNIEAELSRGRQGQLLRRRLSMFNTIWCIGTIVGPLLAAWLYPSRSAVDSAAGRDLINTTYYVAAGLGVAMAGLIALWRTRIPSAEEVLAAAGAEAPHDKVKLKAFLLMSYVANLLCYVVLGVLRQLYEALANYQWHGEGAAQIHSWLLALLATASTLMFALMFFAHKWPYRLKRYALWQGVMVIGLVLVGATASIPVVAAGFVMVGVASSFFYSGSLFYSIEGRDESKHMAGWHEMIIGLGNLGGLLLAGNVPLVLRSLGATDEEWIMRSPYIVAAGFFVVGSAVQLGIYAWHRPRFAPAAADAG